MFLTASLFLLVATPAQASLGRWGLDPSTGDPALSVQWVPAQAADDPQWRSCPPGAACAPIGNGERAVSPGETGPGTVFESDIAPRRGATERRPVWQGRVTAQAAPEVQGELAAGANVRPAAGRWTGGWGDEVSTNVVVACPALTGPGCEFLPDAGATTNTGFADRPLGARHAGWYVYAVEWRTARDTNPFVLASIPPPGETTFRPEQSQLVASSAPAGPVTIPRRQQPRRRCRCRRRRRASSPRSPSANARRATGGA